jgi:methyl-accepting chemotaxis protein
MKMKTVRSIVAVLLGTVALGAGPARSEEHTAEELSAQDREVLGWATQLAAEASQQLEKWIATRQISEEKLFARLYYPIAKTDPPKYATDYGALADRDLPALQEKVVHKSGAIVFAVTTDVNGYLPTHNQRYSMPLTGNLAFDLVNNRTKRIFGDRTGLAAARNEAPYLLQRYKRDTGELMADLSVPVRVHGRHWGCVRIGYRQVEKP